MPQTNSSARRRPTGGSILLLIVLVVSVAMIVPTIQQLITQRQHITELESQIEESKQQIEQVNDEVDRWEDPAYIRAQARGRLLFVEPGDTTYVVIDDESLPAVEDEPDVSSDLHETNTDSTELFLDSLIRANDADAPQETP
ncbi:FtsB family cell division protein [Gulosibacter faecalis]|jgi:cell division protein FtsB|uniref:Septum formation initiator family protein n=1 Tax=Gulosibacter faecalis TaxID=272240 RepID=A0ABW5UXZ4_9MICO|nr:septum formation initiator family protein [Gulosibacter faecalis]